MAPAETDGGGRPVFMCKECLEQFEDRELAYTLIPESRFDHSLKEIFTYRFCSLRHVQNFLHQISHMSQRYILIKHGANGDKQFEPATASELHLLVGSSKAS